jgi:hypothetical protein
MKTPELRVNLNSMRLNLGRDKMNEAHKNYTFAQAKARDIEVDADGSAASLQETRNVSSYRRAGICSNLGLLFGLKNRFPLSV